MVNLITQGPAGDFKAAIMVQARNPQQIIQQSVEDSIRRIEEALGEAPIDQFKGASVLVRLVDGLEKLIQDHVQRAQDDSGLTRYPLIAQLLRNEVDSIKPYLSSPCHQRCNEIYKSLRVNGTMGAVYKNGGFQRSLDA